MGNLASLPASADDAVWASFPSSKLFESASVLTKGSPLTKFVDAALAKPITAEASTFCAYFFLAAALCSSPALRAPCAVRVTAGRSGAQLRSCA